MKWMILTALTVVFASCALFGPKFHHTEFKNASNEESGEIPIIVPPGFVDVQRSQDSLGNYGVLYNYKQGRFFILYAVDTAALTMQIDISENQPLVLETGILVYKGMHENGNYWRLVRNPHIRVGYQDVPEDLEVLFDSATNYAARQLAKQNRN